jgi:hypothetical protein
VCVCVCVCVCRLDLWQIDCSPSPPHGTEELISTHTHTHTHTHTPYRIFLPGWVEEGPSRTDNSSSSRNRDFNFYPDGDIRNCLLADESSQTVRTISVEGTGAESAAATAAAGAARPLLPRFEDALHEVEVVEGIEGRRSEILPLSIKQRYLFERREKAYASSSSSSSRVADPCFALASLLGLVNPATLR